MYEYYWGKVIPPKSKKPVIGEKKESTSDFIEVVGNRIYFYSRIETEKILQLNKNIRNKSADLQRAVINLDQEPVNIHLHINSYGGEIFAGLAGMDEIINSTIPVYTMIDGCCASAATFLSVCGKRRFINRHAYMLVHQLSSGMWGKYEECKDEIKNLDKIMDMIKQVYKEYTKIPMERLDEILKHDLWFDADKCLEYGLVDEIVSSNDIKEIKVKKRKN